MVGSGEHRCSAEVRVVGVFKSGKGVSERCAARCAAGRAPICVIGRCNWCDEDLAPVIKSAHCARGPLAEFLQAEIFESDGGLDI